ncbi:MAG: type II toxin-antitoxin system HicB family antitoxin [Gammaproteobacteria bacterium]
MKSHYSVVIQWSDEDVCYIASLPEFGAYAKTHGATYEEAARNARQALELLNEGGEPSPRPAT